MADWPIFGSGVGLIVISILTWVFRWGRRTDKVNNRLESLEKKAANPGVLPQCADTFTEIKEGLSNLNGKVEAILNFVKPGGKKDE